MRAIPLSVFIFDEEAESFREVTDERYITNLEKTQNILPTNNIQKNWELLSSTVAVESENSYFKQYLNWYYHFLYGVIFTDRVSRGIKDLQTAIALLRKETQRIQNRFGTTFVAESLAKFTEEYNYTYPEKLNLFASLLNNKEITEEELIKLVDAWKIYENINIYSNSTRNYLPKFYQMLHFSSTAEKDNVIDLFNSLKTPITSVLHLLIEHKRFKVFQKLLTHSKLDVNTQDFLLQTPLHLAAQSKWTESRPYVVALLKHPKTELNIKDYKGWTPLFYTLGHTEISSKSTLNTRDIEGLRYMLDAGFRTDIKDIEGRNLVLLASELGMKIVAKYLYKEGINFPTKISAKNTYLQPDFTFTRFGYEPMLDIDSLFYFFEMDEKKASFEDFRNQILTDERFYKIPSPGWERWKYYSLFDLLESVLELEESSRYIHLLGHLYNKNIDSNIMTENIRAIYRGDLSTLKNNFSTSRGLNQLSSGIYTNDYEFETYNTNRTIDKFNILDRMKVKSNSFQNNESSLAFSIHIGSYLSEAIRANQPEVVQFFLSKGADPTTNEKGLVIRSSVMTALLMTSLLHKNTNLEEELNKNKRIINSVINHPKVTQSFLNQEVLPGIKYADLAALKGNIYGLEKIIEKGGQLGNKKIWEGFYIEEITSVLGFIKMTELILNERKRVGVPYDRTFLTDGLSNCQRIFN